MEMMKKHEAQRRAEGTGDAGEEHRMQCHARKHSFNQASTGGGGQTHSRHQASHPTTCSFIHFILAINKNGKKLKMLSDF